MPTGDSAAALGRVFQLGGWPLGSPGGRPRYPLPASHCRVGTEFVLGRSVGLYRPTGPKQGFIDWPTDASGMRRQLSLAADIASDRL
jgi:hypothetical protein